MKRGSEVDSETSYNAAATNTTRKQRFDNEHPRPATGGKQPNVKPGNISSTPVRVSTGGKQPNGGVVGGTGGKHPTTTTTTSKPTTGGKQPATGGKQPQGKELAGKPTTGGKQPYTPGAQRPQQSQQQQPQRSQEPKPQATRPAGGASAGRQPPSYDEDSPPDDQYDSEPEIEQPQPQQKPKTTTTTTTKPKPKPKPKQQQSVSYQQKQSKQQKSTASAPSSSRPVRQAKQHAYVGKRVQVYYVDEGYHGGLIKSVNETTREFVIQWDEGSTSGVTLNEDDETDDPENDDRWNIDNNF